MKKIQKNFPHINRSTLFIVACLVSIIPLIPILLRILHGDLAFWYDPARDLLAGLTNLQNPTLIGQTSGIPGVFYGPYWIWLISFAQLFSMDPRVITFIVLTLPYILFFPFLLSKFGVVLRPSTLILMWLFFLSSYSYYYTDLWNPHPAPLLFLFTIYLLMLHNAEVSRKNMLLTLFGGFVTGLVMNFHLSFGIGMLAGIILYLFINSATIIKTSSEKLQELRKQVILKLVYIAGIIVAFAPFILFEIRHDFMQTKTLLNAFTHFGGGVVGLTGLNKQEILEGFFKRGADLLHLPLYIFAFLFVACFVYYLISYSKRKDRTEFESKLLTIVVSITLGIGAIYLSAKNPIWPYHFIGFEMLVLLLLGLIVNKTKILKSVLGVWVCISLVTTLIAIPSLWKQDVATHQGSLAAKEVIVESIVAEGSKDYAVFALNPAIYMYDYAYLFKVIAQKDFSYDPGSMPDAAVRYLVIPPDAKNKEDFVNYRGSEKEYDTVYVKIFPDKTKVIKKVKKVN